MQIILGLQIVYPHLTEQSILIFNSVIGQENITDANSDTIKCPKYFA